MSNLYVNSINPQSGDTVGIAATTSGSGDLIIAKNAFVAGTVKVTGSTTTGGLTSTALITGSSIQSKGLISATGSISGSSLQSSGLVSGSGDLIVAKNAFVAGTLATTGSVTVGGNLTVNGTTTSVNSTTIAITSSFTFEGAQPNAHETILGVVEPTADGTIKLPAMSAGTYYLPVLAAASTTAVSSTPAELNLLDGCSAATPVNSKAVIYSSSGSITTTGLHSTAIITGSSIQSKGIISATGSLYAGSLSGSGDLIVARDAFVAGNLRVSGTISGSTITVDSTTDIILSGSSEVRIENDMRLDSDSSIFSMGKQDDVTLTHDGTTGVTIAATPITINSTGNLTLDSTTDIVLSGSSEVRVENDMRLDSDSSVLSMGKQDDVTLTHDGTTGLTIAASPVSVNSTGVLTLDSNSVIWLSGSSGVRVEDNMYLDSDSSVLSMGKQDDVTLTHDGTTGVTIAANPITLNSGGGISLAASTVSGSGDLIVAKNAFVAGALRATGSLYSAGLHSTAIITGSSVQSAGIISATGSISGSSIQVSGLVSGSGGLAVAGAAHFSNTLAASGTITGSIFIPEDKYIYIGTGSNAAEPAVTITRGARLSTAFPSIIVSGSMNDWYFETGFEGLDMGGGLIYGSRPAINLTNTATKTNAGHIASPGCPTLIMTKGGGVNADTAGVNGDQLGTIVFKGFNSAGDNETFVQLIATASQVANNDEVGCFSIQTADGSPHGGYSGGSSPQERLRVSGSSTHIFGELQVKGGGSKTGQISSSADLIVAKNAFVAGALKITGSTTTGGLTSTAIITGSSIQSKGIISATGSLYAGSISGSGDLIVAKNAFVAGNLKVTGTLSGSDLTLGDNLAAISMGSTNPVTLTHHHAYGGGLVFGGSKELYFRSEDDTAISSPSSGRLHLQAYGGNANDITLTAKFGGISISSSAGAPIALSSTGSVLIKTATPVLTGGGIDAVSPTMYVGEVNGEIVTTILIDIGAGSIVSSGVAGDVIGEDGVAYAYLTLINTAINGVVYKGEMACVEVPTTGDPDINLAAHVTPDLAEDQAGEGNHVLVNGGVWTLGAKADLTIPSGGIVNDYLYLTHGGTTAGTYDAGKFIIKLYGANF